MSTKQRKLFNALWLIAATVISSASAQEANRTKPEQVSAVVRVDSGQLQGVEADGVISFKGIPFAAPPVGELRWRPPQPTPKWTGVREAKEFGPSCMQGRGFGPPPGAGAPAAQGPSEDCLYLNVWRPADSAARNLPVMVWIFGGGFVGGSSSSPMTSGVPFAKQGVILVAMNYRVGRFGFFAFPALSSERPNENKGNYAYMDQIAALQWVKRNIAAIGGNPNNVTIFGFSAGGVSVHSMLASPQARGLFHKAIVHSGGSRDSVLTARPMRTDGVDPNYPVSAETIGINFAKSMGIEGTDQAALAKLRSLSADEVLRGPTPQPGVTVPSYETTPILDGKLITETAETAYKTGRQQRVPLMLGSNSADTAGNRIKARTKEEFFARYDQWSARRRRPTIPTARPTSPRWCRGPTTTLVRPSRRASPQTPSLPTVRLSICICSRTSRQRCGNSYERGHRTAEMSPLPSARWAEAAAARQHRRTWRSRGWRKAIGSTSPRLAIRTDRDCQAGRATSRAKIKSSLSVPMVLRVLGRTSAKRGSM